jgi:hypothetical protein
MKLKVSSRISALTRTAQAKVALDMPKVIGLHLSRVWAWGTLHDCLHLRDTMPSVSLTKLAPLLTWRSIDNVCRKITLRPSRTSSSKRVGGTASSTVTDPAPS